MAGASAVLPVGRGTGGGGEAGTTRRTGRTRDGTGREEEGLVDEATVLSNTEVDPPAGAGAMGAGGRGVEGVASGMVSVAPSSTLDPIAAAILVA